MTRHPARLVPATAALLWTLQCFQISLPAAAFSSAQPVAFPHTQLIVASASGVQHEFTVEVARTPAQRSRGLMYRTRLAADQGMLFLYTAPQVARMWMKNTPLALDMLFVTADGRITKITEHTEPRSTRTITSDQPVAAVLELVGGRCAELGIIPGDHVLHPAFVARSGAARP